MPITLCYMGKWRSVSTHCQEGLDTMQEETAFLNRNVCLQCFQERFPCASHVLCQLYVITLTHPTPQNTKCWGCKCRIKAIIYTPEEVTDAHLNIQISICRGISQLSRDRKLAHTHKGSTSRPLGSVLQSQHTIAFQRCAGNPTIKSQKEFTHSICDHNREEEPHLHYNSTNVTLKLHTHKSFFGSLRP